MPERSISANPRDRPAAVWHIAANAVTQPCGCASWMQFERGQWVDKTWRCIRHEDG